MHRARPVGHRHDQADAVLARRRRCGQGLRKANHGKACAVESIVLNGVRGVVQTKLPASAFAGNTGPGRVGSGQARAFGVARGGAALGVGQVCGQPALALGQCLRVRVNRLDAFQRVGQTQQVVAHHQAGFAHDVQR